MRALALALLLVPAAASAETQLTVLAAASLKVPLEAAASDFSREHPGVQVIVSAAATGVLVRQVEAGAPADVLVGAAAPPLERLRKVGLLGEPTVIARNTLVVVLPSHSALQVKRLSDLQQPGVKRLAMGRPGTVPAGDYAREALVRAGLLEPLSPRLVFGESVTQVLTQVRHGDVDAGFVYASDARLADGEVRVTLAVDPRLHAPIVYPAAVLKSSSAPELAAAFVGFLRTPRGQRSLLDAGLQAP